ncbi:MAG: 16S rRNA (cytosine(1402)-N(4))-methyltransferase RsmH, partial [Hyphomicrobiales bacterium]|nr:16S rRNA (cytosine(1402)-N(4))-methyltransferase RsmH [Hyphomicrobiales bacterium]
MLSHVVPPSDCAPAWSPRSATQRLKRICSRAEGLPGGSISFEFHPPLRRQGADLDTRAVPSGAGEGRLRRRLRLSLARRAGARLWGQCADRRDRFAAANDAAVFAVPRRVRDGALGHERSLAPRRGGQGLLRGTAQDFVGAWARGGVRGAGAQVPDLGADALSGPSRTGSRARAALARGARRARAVRGAGMSAASAAPGHVPVLLHEAMEALDPRAGGLYVDGTFGGGGYARALLERAARVIALDRDPSAIRAGVELAALSGGRLELVEARFGELDEVMRRLGVEAVDGIVLDIGVSSMQLDEAARGFSLRFDAPLDMRMGGSGRSAADILRDEDEATIADILFHFGEERAARRIARAIVADRKTKPFTSTLELAGLVARVAPARRGELTHPATRTFQALRIAVNDELAELVSGLSAAERLLKPGGRLAVVTFHSLEDRIVKQFFAGRSGRGRAASRRLPGEPAEAEPTFDVPRGQPV